MNNESHRRRKNIHRWIIKTELVRISHLSTSTSLLKHIDGEKFFFEAFAHEDEHLRLTMRVPVEIMIFATFEVFVAATEHPCTSICYHRTDLGLAFDCLPAQSLLCRNHAVFRKRQTPQHPNYQANLQCLENLLL